VLSLPGQLRAQAEKPPEQEGKPVPEKLPPLDAPKPETKGKLAVTYPGASSFPEDKLKDAIKRQIASIEDGGLDDASAYDAAFFLESFYHKNGFPKAEVTSRIQGAWALALEVKEGPRTKVGVVNFRGNKAYDDKNLTNYLLGPTRERFPNIKVDTDLPFVEADVGNGLDLVRRLYASDGYLDAVVDNPVFKLSAGQQSAAVTVVIHEGKQYHFGEVTLHGNTAFSSDVLKKEITDQSGQPYTPGRQAAAGRKLEDYYKKRGYFGVKVDAESERQESKGLMAVTFTITEGPVYHFDGITVHGLKDVKPSFVQKRFEKLEGKTYDPDLIDKEFREMLKTGLFKNLRITPKPVGDDKVELDVVADEAKPKEVGFYAGFSSLRAAFLA
jgi:outer membrane protein insertion porin family